MQMEQGWPQMTTTLTQTNKSCVQEQWGEMGQIFCLRSPQKQWFPAKEENTACLCHPASVWSSGTEERDCHKWVTDSFCHILCHFVLFSEVLMQPHFGRLPHMCSVWGKSESGAKYSVSVLTEMIKWGWLGGQALPKSNKQLNANAKLNATKRIINADQNEMQKTGEKNWTTQLYFCSIGRLVLPVILEHTFRLILVPGKICVFGLATAFRK